MTTGAANVGAVSKEGVYSIGRIARCIVFRVRLAQWIVELIASVNVCATSRWAIVGNWNRGRTLHILVVRLEKVR